MFVANCPSITNMYIYYSQKELKHLGLEILVIHGILEHIILNIFKYILIHLYQIQKKKLNFSQRILNYIKCYKDFNTLYLYTLKALLSKNLFFLILWHAKVPPSIGIPRFF